jgi:predicted O-methyltransferase YrrM
MGHRRFGLLTTEDQVDLLVGFVKSGHSPVVEFGTFTGHTARRLAEAGAEVHTIDIGRDADSRSYGKYRVGEEFEGLGLPIIQYLGDSREVDLSHLYGKIGLVFIDGGHSYEVVKHDSVEAFKLIRPGGMIVWDDCSVDWPGVTGVVAELSLSCNIAFNKKFSMAVCGLTEKASG